MFVASTTSLASAAMTNSLVASFCFHYWRRVFEVDVVTCVPIYYLSNTVVTIIFSMFFSLPIWPSTGPFWRKKWVKPLKLTFASTVFCSFSVQFIVESTSPELLFYAASIIPKMQVKRRFFYPNSKYARSHASKVLISLVLSGSIKLTCTLCNLENFFHPVQWTIFIEKNIFGSGVGPTGTIEKLQSIENCFFI